MLKFLLSRVPEERTQPNILLIDDDRDIRTVTRLVLLTQKVGEVLEAGSGQEGVALARAKRPDAILLDMRLPDMTGETVLQLLRADPWTKDIPVVLFTAFAEDVGRLKALNVSEIVLKPFHSLRLCEVIRRAIALRKASPGAMPFQPRIDEMRSAAMATV